MGASLNLRPDLYKAAILGVPFVDVLTTMLDDTIPLTTTEVRTSAVICGTTDGPACTCTLEHFELAAT